MGHHEDEHFVEAYSREVLRLLAGVPGVADGEQAWKDMKFNLGMGEFRQLFLAAVRVSTARATAASIEGSERAEMRRRGARRVDED